VLGHALLVLRRTADLHILERVNPFFDLFQTLGDTCNLIHDAAALARGLLLFRLRRADLLVVLVDLKLESGWVVYLRSKPGRRFMSGSSSSAAQDSWRTH
jgi:hypothetical protein